MNNTLRLVSVYGPWICMGIIILTAGVYLFFNRKNPYFLPVKAVGWIGVAITIVVIAMAGSSFFFINKQFGPLKKIYESTGRPVPDIQFDNLSNNSELKLSDLRGHPVLLNFWATWCSPCIREMPDLDRIQTRFRNRGLIVITASDEKRETIRKFITENPLLTVEAHVDSSIYKISTFTPVRYIRPVTFLIDRKGIIRQALVGGQDYQGFLAMVNPLFANSSQSPAE